MTEKIYQIGLVGAGNIARIHAAAIADIPNAQVMAVCDTSEPACRAFAADYETDWTGDLDELLARDDLDVVDICTPSGTHADLAVRAAQAGKHLVVEKPLDVTLERVDRIIDAAYKNGIKLTGIFHNRFKLGAQKAKEAIDQGRLGRLVLVDAYVKWYRSQEYYQGWHGTWALDGGGALMNQSIHSIDLLQWIGGPVSTVFGHAAALGHEIETEDTTSAVLTFESGALGVIQGATSCWPGEPARVEVHGTRGTIILEDARIRTWKLADASEEEEQAMMALETPEGNTSSDPTALSHTAHRLQIEDLLGAIEEDRDPRIDGSEARKAVEIIRGIYLSAQQGVEMGFPLTDPDG
jgi:predicted dehydrogenase